MSNSLIFDTIPRRVKRNKFLLTDTFTTNNFSGTDTEELYQENLKKQPADWCYRTNPVKYTVNSLGYRTEEFKKIDWANSIVIFGCSYVFGVGVDDKDTMPYYLSQLTGMPVVNMGVGGSSIGYSFHNSLILRDGYPTPKAVIQMWSGADRTVYYYKKRLESFGAWNADKSPYMRAWAEDQDHAETHALFASKASNWLWKDTKYFEGSYFYETAKLLDCYFVKPKDFARDLIHYGKHTHYNVALEIIKQLKL